MEKLKSTLQLTMFHITSTWWRFFTSPKPHSTHVHDFTSHPRDEDSLHPPNHTQHMYMSSRWLKLSVGWNNVATHWWFLYTFIVQKQLNTHPLCRQLIFLSISLTGSRWSTNRPSIFRLLLTQKQIIRHFVTNSLICTPHIHRFPHPQSTLNTLTLWQTASYVHPTSTDSHSSQNTLNTCTWHWRDRVKLSLGWDNLFHPLLVSSVFPSLQMIRNIITYNIPLLPLFCLPRQW